MGVSVSSQSVTPYDDIPSDVMTPFDPRVPNAGGTIGTINRGTFCRVVAKKSGFLRDMTAFCTVQSGNIDIGVYDTGDTTTTVRTKLGSSGSIACPATYTPPGVVTWDPGAGVIPIVAGRQYDFGLSVDNVTAAFLRLACLVTWLPTGFQVVPGAASPRLTYINNSVFPLPGTIAEGTMASVANTYLIMARVSTT